MKFTKWSACGNDFVFVNAMKRSIDPIVAECPAICDRHFGIGADGIIFILPSDKAALRMRIFNSDGSEAEMCGNGIRAFALWAYELGLVKEKTFTVETGAGILTPSIRDDGTVRVDMGKPHLAAEEIPAENLGEGPIIRALLKKDDREEEVTCVSMGNPHCVIFREDEALLRPEEDGPDLEVDTHFPRKTNVEFAYKREDGTIRMRVWERGVGVTLACGTGSCATLAAAVLNGLVEKEADIILDGGTVHVEWDREGDGHIFLTGPAKEVFEGTYPLKGEA